MIKISIVIPCRNEAPYIEECIRAIYAAEVPDEVKINVFVVDGMSNDGTRRIIQQLQEEFLTLKIVDNVQQLTPFAFNLGIHATSCDYVQIIGARHIISKNYLSVCLQKLNEDSSIWCVGGRLENEYVNETGKVIALAMGTQLGMGIGNFRTLSKSGFTDTVTSPMYPYGVFEKIGFFDEELIRNQDDDFNFRVTQAGGKIWFDADISLKYYVRGNYKNLWKQFYQYGYWKVYVNRKHRTFTTVRQLIPPLFVMYLLLFLFTWLFGATVGVAGSFPLIVYLALTAITTNRLVQQDHQLRFGDVFKTFPILHISYGLGYLKGVIDFVLLNKKPSDKQKQMSR